MYRYTIATFLFTRHFSLFLTLFLTNNTIRILGRPTYVRYTIATFLYATNFSLSLTLFLTHRLTVIVYKYSRCTYVRYTIV